LSKVKIVIVTGMGEIMTRATEQLLRVLFYKLYCTPRRYHTNINFIFSIKEMLGLSDDKFRMLCEDLDEESLSEDLPKIMRNSLETIEEELEKRETLVIGKEFESLLDLNDDEKLIERAFYHIDSGQIDEGIAVLKSGLVGDKYNPEIVLHLSEAYVIASDFKSARKVLEETEVNGEYKDVVDARLRALKLEFADEEYQRDIFCEMYKLRGDQKFRNGEFMGAANDYLHILRIMPGDYETMIKLGGCFWRMGDKTAAIRFFHQSLIIMEMPVFVS
jgi:tetratricopeptide (TPR) repeat protein